MPRTTTAAMIAVSLLATSCALGQTVAGVWGSPLYRAELAVSGKTVSGTFTSIDNPQAPAGKITGQLAADGKSFTANWTGTAGEDPTAFSTWMAFGAKGAVLNGYRWSDETSPTGFSLHRAVGGQVPVLVDESGSSGSTGVVTKPGGTGETGNTTVASPYKVEVIACERFADGQPVNTGEQFTAAKSICAFVRFTNLPTGTKIEWVWTRGGQPQPGLTKTAGGSGWQAHGLQSDTGLPAGTYTVTVKINGQAVATRTITVRAAGGAATPTATTATTTGASATGAAGTGPAQFEVILCERAPNGQPENQGTTFTKPTQLTCLVKHHNLPANTKVLWVWKRGGAEVSRQEKVLTGTGWAWHGLTNANGMTSGFYEVSVTALGMVVTTIRATVH